MPHPEAPEVLRDEVLEPGELRLVGSEAPAALRALVVAVGFQELRDDGFCRADLPRHRVRRGMLGLALVVLARHAARVVREHVQVGGQVTDHARVLVLPVLRQERVDRRPPITGHARQRKG